MGLPVARINCVLDALSTACPVYSEECTNNTVFMTTAFTVAEEHPVAVVGTGGAGSSASLESALHSTRTGLTSVLCGSFRRDTAGLRRSFDRLGNLTTLLSPSSIDFVDPDAAFVRLAHEVADDVNAIEGRHLQAVANADLVWLHAPEGYVGSSAALEVGHAAALGVPVFCSTAPADQTLAAFVTVVEGPEAAVQGLVAAPGTGLSGLQAYYGRVAGRRGWAAESPRDTLLLLTEEFGELARAIRKSSGMRRDGEYPLTDVGDELADVTLYLVHLANTLGVDLAEAVTRKESINQARFVGATKAA